MLSTANGIDMVTFESPCVVFLEHDKLCITLHASDFVRPVRPVTLNSNPLWAHGWESETWIQRLVETLRDGLVSG